MFGFPPGGLLSRFVAICSAVLLGVVAVGLRRGEAWVGRAMELCIGLWVLKLVAGNLEVLGWAFRTGLWVRVGIMVAILYLPVHYVKRKLRQWYGPAMPPAPPPPAPLPAAPFTRV
ncbi:MAG TPA: hypothetical protein VFX98_19330 [Longimicrobiaceae bacterium]|nr:hypothetical protein [Longimicrobiaceae bacterium]